MKTALAALAMFTLGACASTETQRSYTPKVQVLVKGPKARAAEANYQVAPGESVTGLGGSAK